MILSWNTRGLNKSGKAREIGSRLLSLRPEIVVLIETRVKTAKAENVRNNLRLKGKYLDNYLNHDNGRIWLYWDDRVVDVKFISSTAQMIHCGIYDTNGTFLYWFTAIYALNLLEHRRKLWTDLEGLHQQQQGPWCLMGDFNNVLKAADRIGGKMVHESEYSDMASMMEKVGLAEMDSLGDYYTWSNKHVDGTIYSRIDRVLGNVDWFQLNLDATLNNLDPGISDHALMCLNGRENSPTVPRTSNFKFLNCVTTMAGFSDCVSNCWNVPLDGRPMFVLWRKLIRLQPVIRKLSKPITSINITLEKAREDLKQAHNRLQQDRMNPHHIMEVKNCTDEIIRWNEIEEQMLRQKANIEWLRHGDGNNKYFHASIKAKQKQCDLKTLYREDGTMITSHEDIEHEVLNLYGNLMGKAEDNLDGIDIVAMREGPQITNEQREFLVAPILEDEIFRALKSIGDLKAPGLDGFGANFFKTAWSIVKKDVIAAVMEFFYNEKIYSAINSTLVTLIPKHSAAKTIKEYRPISCCTTIFKIISKILTMRLSKVIGSIVNHSQAAFVPGQHIHDHILLAYELIRGYSRKGGTPKCMLQLDLQKAYDTVDWHALQHILREIGLPNQFIRWIMLGVTSVSYKFNIHGRYTGYMKARRGLRQGDPISPLLFVMVMEYMHRTLQRLKKVPDFNFHSKCENLNIINLSFADDLLIFTRGDKKSVELVMAKIHDFSRSTGLHVNPSKCKVFYGGVEEHVKDCIRAVTSFTEGSLPFRYLGIPLTSKKLSIHHYMPLVDRIVERIRNWSAKLLSHAGRLQLIASVTFAVANYWMQCLPLPKKVIHKINAICRSFLWSGGAVITRKSLVSWDHVCAPKAKGGLNLISLEEWNRANMTKLLWNINNKADSLWIRWIHSYYIKQDNLMTMPVKQNSSWILKAILQQRDSLQQVQGWNNMKGKIITRKVYQMLRVDYAVVGWRQTMYQNMARPRALFVFWLACHCRLATKDRLQKFGVIVNLKCCFCHNDETINHLFFGCIELKNIWHKVLRWLKVDHVPMEWNEELRWITRSSKGKGWKAQLLKSAAAETVYTLWKYRNDVCFGNQVYNTNIDEDIINTIVYRGWRSPKLREHIAHLLI
ncbi:unnamed protein product [Trifolium pratense]|uniref:Uncharacterized protein n=1 Tax=Trifolium pratense TaxID=57577 RepID=A0ACB0L112_TRIPR|nr:unnamed protein product [Trifolium pratense]